MSEPENHVLCLKAMCISLCVWIACTCSLSFFFFCCVVDPFKNLFLKWKVKAKVAQSSPTLCDPIDYTVHGILQTRILEWVASLSLLQGIFPTQGSSPCLSSYRRILHHLSHQGSPYHIALAYYLANSVCTVWLLIQHSEYFKNSTGLYY